MHASEKSLAVLAAAHRTAFRYLQELAKLQGLLMPKDVCQNVNCHFGPSIWTVGPLDFVFSFDSLFSSCRHVFRRRCLRGSGDDVGQLATVDSLAVPREEADSDQEWEKVTGGRS